MGPVTRQRCSRDGGPTHNARQRGSLAVRTSVASFAVLVLLALGGCRGSGGGSPASDPAINVGDDDLGGIVASASGPEAGVWVIAGTTDLPTGFGKIVVTDESGRYLLPDLPKATYRVWVRGYGLVDSPAVTTTPGKPLDLTATAAPDAAAAAEYYPGVYWYPCCASPTPASFPGPERRATESPGS